MVNKTYVIQNKIKEGFDGTKPQQNDPGEAGRLRGLATAKNHGKAFYQEIGQKGGEATSKTHNREFYQEIGQKGGEATSQKHDKGFYRDIGRKGGVSRSKPGFNA